MPVPAQKIPIIRLCSTILLSMLFGYVVGRITAVKLSIPDTPITIRDDIRPHIPVVSIEGVRDGSLRGTMNGDVRLFIGEEYVIPDGSGAFTLKLDLLLENVITVLIPDGMNFVASKRGKKYHPVRSSQGERLVPENRVYFRTEAEAQAAGYTSSY